MTQTTPAETPKETPKQASAPVIAQHAATLTALPFSDVRDFDDAARGFLGSVENAKITSPQGRTVWSLEPYGFLSAEQAPPTVDPSLWRQSRLNMHHGLFEVVPGVYQVRGLDIANMTLIEGDSGVIVVDTLTSIEGARTAMELYFEHRGRRPVAAVIFTHTHTDHWGGARGLLDDDMLASGRVPIIAPNLFMEHAVSENIIAGPAMLRRAQYQFGPFLAKGLRGQVDCGLGKSMASDSNSRWRRTAKRRRKCISSSRVTSCSILRRTARTISTICFRSVAPTCAMRSPGRNIWARRCRYGAARLMRGAVSTIGRSVALSASIR